MNDPILQLFHCIVSNEGCQASSTIVATNDASIQVYGSTIRGGALAGISSFASSLLIAFSNISNNQGNGLSLTDSDVSMESTNISSNGHVGISVTSSSLLMSCCSFTQNTLGSLLIDDINECDSYVKVGQCSGDEDLMQMLQAHRSLSDKCETSNTVPASYRSPDSLTAIGEENSGHVKEDDMNDEEGRSYYPFFLPSQDSKHAIIAQIS